MTGHGPDPYVVNIEETTLATESFRPTLWTGMNSQRTVVSIPLRSDIGLEVHPQHVQFFRLERVKGRMQMGPSEDDFVYELEVEADWSSGFRQTCGTSLRTSVTSRGSCIRATVHRAMSTTP